MQRKLKSQLSKINFILGRNPKIEKFSSFRRFIPEPYHSVITISADFELAWAWRYTKSSSDPLAKTLKKAELERKNVPVILELCEKFNIPVSWMTVGHLFLENCSKENGIPHADLPRLAHFENEFWKFEGDDWFEYDPCSNYKDAPEWYAPDLIEMILQSKVKHEIGCHTFSHIDCRDGVCPAGLFEAEVKECQKIAAKFNIELKSFVHPGHTIGNLDKLAEMGFTSFQSDPGNILGYPVRHKNGLWELKRTYEFVYRKDWSIDYHIYRYKKIIERAIKNHSVCNFWFHPSFEERFLLEIMPTIFSYLDSQRKNVFITTVQNYINWLNEQQ